MGRILLVDADLSRSLQLPADYGIREQFLLKSNPELKRQVHVQNWNIERRSVIRSINVRLRSIDLLESCDLYRRKDRLHDQPRPCLRKPVQPFSLSVEESPRQGQDSQNHRVQPDQRIENEVRPQPTHPPIGFFGNCMWAGPDRNRPKRFAWLRRTFPYSLDR